MPLVFSLIPEGGHTRSILDAHSEGLTRLNYPISAEHTLVLHVQECLIVNKLGGRCLLRLQYERGRESLAAPLVPSIGVRISGLKISLHGFFATVYIILYCALKRLDV